MSPIEWRVEYSVGNTAVDEEHRELIEAINALLDEVARGATTDQLVEGLGEIYAQIASHFALEEKLMLDSRYGPYPSHKEDHEVLLDELSDIIDAVELGDSYDDRELSSTLDRWFVEHFRTHDARLHGKLRH